MNEELRIIIDKLRKAQNIIWEVENILRKKGIDSMLRYCEDYTSIAIEEIKTWNRKSEVKDNGN